MLLKGVERTYKERKGLFEFRDLLFGE